jgi:sulfide dehydrogenase cytochrome subunit
MRVRKKAFLVMLSLLMSSSIMAAERGQVLADSCLSCHAGVDRNATIINLSQYPSSAIVSQMKAFRDGTREGTVMTRHAKGYTDEDIAQLAKYIGIQGK